MSDRYLCDIHQPIELMCQKQFSLTPGLYNSSDDSGKAINDLRIFARSTNINVGTSLQSVELNGMDLGHYRADPDLGDTCELIPEFIDFSNPELFHRSCSHFDLCLEDNWTGYFISRFLKSTQSPEPIVLLHLDDHTDMMSTLLELRTAQGMGDEIDDVFNPLSHLDWHEAITSGAVGIGSFVTALYFLEQPLHVCHLRQREHDSEATTDIYSDTVSHPLIPDTRFAAVSQNRNTENQHCLGTYRRHSSAQRLLNGLPAAIVIVHIDLDYFINDYNGNIGAQMKHPFPVSRKCAIELADSFFNALTAHGVVVERWIIGISPGFCGVRHWQWLLEYLKTHIARTGTPITTVLSKSGKSNRKSI